MILWFAALSFAAVLLVFDSPALDYRLVIAGSLLPWIEHLWAPPWVMHSVLFPVAVMMVVMVAGWGRRLWQRRWLGLAIGLFLHLVLDATWTRQAAFWWPLGGDDVDPSPFGLPVRVVLEVLGLGVSLWLWKRLGLGQRERLDLFVRSGRVDRSALAG